MIDQRYGVEQDGVEQAANAMSVGLSFIQRWLQQYRQEMRGITSQAKAISPEQQRIQALEAENRQLKRDNDLLKKALVFLSGMNNLF